ncbi:MAG: hypothetical protein HZA20_06235 [Nitrospirae bacterium]|nr:hypothetical protein [Nitrospirota bacterium]
MNRLLLASAFMVMLASCGPSTFIVSRDSSSYYFGSESQSLKRMICDTGDLERVLRDAEIPEHLKSDFNEYVCTEKRSREKVIALYAFLSPEEKRSLKRAFSMRGYMVNHVAC